MTIRREEILAQVLCILSYRDEDEAIVIANETVAQGFSCARISPGLCSAL